jgi:hypothetical protein
MSLGKYLFDKLNEHDPFLLYEWMKIRYEQVKGDEEE